jgi:hypothetical protein
MKTVWVLIAVIAVVSVLHAYKAAQRSGISGKIIPYGVGQTIWAVRGNDSVRLVTTGGAFLIEAKPGSYNVIINGKEPFSNLLLQNIEVVNGKTTELGEVKLSQ